MVNYQLQYLNSVLRGWVYMLRLELTFWHVYILANKVGMLTWISS